MTKFMITITVACSTVVWLGGTAAASDSNARRRQPEVTLSQVLELAVQQSPRLRAARIEPAIARAQLVQAGLVPNPFLAFQYKRLVEGDLPQNRFDLDLSMPIDVSGRRRLAREAAALDVRGAELRLDAALLAMTTEVRTQFLKVLYLQRLVALRKQSEDLAEQLARAAKTRHELGDLSEAASEFAELTLEQARGERLQAEGELNQAIGTMDLLVGGGLPDTFVAGGELAVPRVGCDREALLAIMQRTHPDAQLLRFAVERANVGVRSTRAQRVPLMDMGITLDVRDPGATLFGGTFAIPLPMFDRRQGEIAAAGHRVELAREHQAEAELSAAQQVDAVCGEITTAERVLAHMEERVLPLADNTRTRLEAELRLGEIRFEETLIAARQLVEIRVQMLDALYRHAAARLALRAAIGDVSP